MATLLESVDVFELLIGEAVAEIVDDAVGDDTETDAEFIEDDGEAVVVKVAEGVVVDGVAMGVAVVFEDELESRHAQFSDQDNKSTFTHHD